MVRMVFGLAGFLFHRPHARHDFSVGGADGMQIRFGDFGSAEIEGGVRLAVNLHVDLRGLLGDLDLGEHLPCDQDSGENYETHANK